MSKTTNLMMDIAAYIEELEAEAEAMGNDRESKLLLTRVERLRQICTPYLPIVSVG